MTRAAVYLRISRIDPELGNVRKFARDLVRQGFAEAYPDLKLPEETS